MQIKSQDKPCKDHLGHPFSCVRDMYLFWGLTEWTFYQRKHAGWSLEKILTTPLKVQKNNALNDLASYARHRKDKQHSSGNYRKVSEEKKVFDGGYVVITEYQR